MEVQTASVYSTGSVPRLRVTRRAASPPRHINDGLEQLVLPPPSDFKRSSPYPDSQTTSEDEFGAAEYAGANSRLLSASLPPADSSTQSSETTHRLRALLNRFDHASRPPLAPPRVVMPPSPSDHESDFDLRPAQAERASIKDLFNNALREPGETPQKPKVIRRASFNVMDSPKVSKTRRKSTSDEERELLSTHQDGRPSDFSTAASLDRLRLQLTESMPSIQDASSVTSAHRAASESSVLTPKRAISSHSRPPSKITVVHSPVDRAKFHKDLEPFKSVNEAQSSDLYSPQGLKDTKHPSRARNSADVYSSSHISFPRTNGSTSAETTSHNKHVHQQLFQAGSIQSDADHQERLNTLQHETDADRERGWNYRHPSPQRNRTTSSDNLHPVGGKGTGRVSPGAWPTPPPPGTSPSSSRSPRHSFNRQENGLGEKHSDEGDSPRSTSTTSTAEYRERLKEAERERQRERERLWNRPSPRHSEPTPHLHGEKLGVHVEAPPSTSSYSQERTHLRPHSRTGDDRTRSTSPMSSMTSSNEGKPSDKRPETEHERERNWNAPSRKGHHTLNRHDDTGILDHLYRRISSPIQSALPGDELQNEHSRHRKASPVNAANGHTHSRTSSHPNGVPLEHSSLGYSHERPRSVSPLPLTSDHSLQEEEKETLHERERNWNAPRARWEHPYSHHPHHLEIGPAPSHDTSSSPSRHSGSTKKEHDVQSERHRTNSSLNVSDAPSAKSISPTSHLHAHSLTSGHGVSIRPKSPTPPSHLLVHRSGPRSPLPPLIINTQQAKTGFDNDMNRDSPTVSPSQRHARTPSSPSPAPSRHRSRSSKNGSWRRDIHLTVRDSSPVAPEEVLRLVADPSKRHRRTTTELSESMGPFPRQNGLPSSLTVPDDSDSSLFTDESVPPPQMSTPTFKATQIPDLSISPTPSDVPLPPSPSSPVAVRRDSAARADTDLVRLQRAVAPKFTFPARRPSLSPPISPTPPSVPSTPPPQSSSYNPRTQFKTPSPPVGLPELPDPPSDEGENNTSIKGEELATDMTPATRTPRPPGAFGTPAPMVALPPQIDETPSFDTPSSEEAEATPKLGPVNLPPQTSDFVSASLTPAPPGAYRPTPTPAKRKGILKVRFDGDAQLPTLEDPALESPSATNSIPNGDTGGKTFSSSSEDMPPLDLSPTRRKGLRLVDEYGRARRFTEDGEEIILDSRRKLVRASESLDPSMVDVTLTPRRRAKMRQVDAFGNEVTAGTGLKPDEPNVPESRRKKAAISKLTKSLEELQKHLAEEEDTLTTSAPVSGRDDERLTDLATVSKAARAERNRLTQKLQLERHVEGGIADKIFIARNPVRDMSLERTPWWKRKWRLVIVILVLELVLLFMGYRIAMIHAKHIWLKTYFDPFFPALYLHSSRPSFLSRFGSLPMDWSAFAISGAVGRVGVRGFVVGVSKRLWEEIWSLRLEPWEAWGSPAAGPPVPRPWPS